MEKSPQRTLSFDSGHSNRFAFLIFPLPIFVIPFRRVLCLVNRPASVSIAFRRPCSCSSRWSSRARRRKTRLCQADGYKEHLKDRESRSWTGSLQWTRHRHQCLVWIWNQRGGNPLQWFCHAATNALLRIWCEVSGYRGGWQWVGNQKLR